MIIVRSILVFFIIGIIYSLFVSTIKIDNFQPINQFQGNMIAKEELLYADLQHKTCFLTGSSLTYRLKEEFLPDEYQNMAIAGSSSGYGLRKIVERGIVPDILVIETNLLGRSQGQVELGSIQNNDNVSQPVRILKSYVPITLQKNQPVSVAMNLLSEVFLGGRNTGTTSKTARAREIMAERQQVVYAETLEDDEQTRRSFEAYHAYVDGLEEKGTCVVFMEMPISCTLMDSNLATSTRERYQRAFPPEQYRYISLPNCQEIETTDGIHLSAKSAKIVAQYLVTELSKIDCK